MTLISPTEAGARFAGVLALVAIGFLHLINFSRVAGEGAWGMAFVVGALIVAGFLVSLALVRSDSHIVRTAWLHATGLALALLSIHFLSRTSGLPGMEAVQGSFFSFFGLLEVFAGFGLISTAAYAMRELTLEGVGHRHTTRRRTLGVPGGTAAGYYSVVVAVILALPAIASAAKPEAAGGKADKADKLIDPVAIDPVSATNGFLSGFEISVAFLLSLAFLVWSARTLRERSATSAAAYY